jgi:hypothetical protein
VCVSLAHLNNDAPLWLILWRRCGRSVAATTAAAFGWRNHTVAMFFFFFNFFSFFCFIFIFLLLPLLIIPRHCYITGGGISIVCLQSQRPRLLLLLVVFLFCIFILRLPFIDFRYVRMPRGRDSVSVSFSNFYFLKKNCVWIDSRGGTHFTFKLNPIFQRFVI